jgi:hypothetical protein
METKYMAEDLPNKRLEYEETKSNSRTFISGKAKYIGGHAEITGESVGKLTITSRGVFFESIKGNDFFDIPVEAILKAEGQTLDDVAKHSVFARYLALSGFALAFKKKLKGSAVFFTIDYASYGIECSALFEAELSQAFAVATARACEDYQRKKKAEEEKLKEKQEKPKEEKVMFEHKSIAELMIDINELYARGVLSYDEFSAKKRDLLSRI